MPLKPGTIFLDDDFRLAPSPGEIGGCFCDEHKAKFLKKHGYNETQWKELLDAVARREPTPLLNAWLEDACDELTACFRAQQAAAAPDAQLGIMVMFLGAEKAGIRLTDYRDVPFRVGELMFDDASFTPPKGKTNELFSALFHRRFVQPERAYSETTAYPPDKLSAVNMAAKLAVSTLADVRNTMMMSGLDAFPRTHWATLGPAMRRQAGLHEAIGGHTPRGPFKHFWGERARRVGDDNPFSLFLACGVPFEVIDRPAATGWVFLGNDDARAVAAGQRKPAGGTFVHRPEAGGKIDGARALPETFEALFALKHEILPTLRDTPYVEQDLPIVCAWYPTARAVLLWNLTDQPQQVTVKWKDQPRPATLVPLGTELLREIG